MNHVTFIEHDTLIFLDEIQDCPNARTALKFLAIDGRYDVIASGSLLGLHDKEMASISVGYERTMDMFSLDFEEFLWAVGKSGQAIEVLREYFERREKVDPGIHETFMNLLREYLVIGGMPEVVNSFLRTNNYQEAYAVQKKIMESYREDIKHYASAQMRQKISDCYHSIPRQLAKEYTKFQYKVVSKDGNARRFLYGKEGNVIPIEVKSKNGATVSLNHFIAEYMPPYAYKLIAGNLGTSGIKITLPLYMAMFI